VFVRAGIVRRNRHVHSRHRARRGDAGLCGVVRNIDGPGAGQRVRFPGPARYLLGAMLRAQVVSARMRGRLRARVRGGLQGSLAGVELPEPDALLPATLRQPEHAARATAVADQVRFRAG